jgi:flagellar biosynthesis GTPase FlhF
VTSKDPGWEAQVLFREFFLPFINEVFVSKTHKEQQRILPLLVNILESKAISRKMSDRLLNYLITIALKNKLETREVISERFQALMEKALLNQQKPKDTKQEAKGLADGEEELVEEEKGTETLSHQKKELEKNEIDKPGEKVLEELEKELEAIEEETTEKTKKPWQEDKEKQRFRLFNEELECYVSNAGLVLLHPFLPYLFDGLGLLDKKKKFKSEEGAFRATHLLQYLATGESATPEHELSLNKILCGLDLNEPVPYEVELSVNEKEECDNLLKVVLERWEVLKTTNIEALREGFLNRDGRLAFKGNGWNLFIERTTLDVMMDRLPWSISIIKIPWREDLIYVEW